MGNVVSDPRQSGQFSRNRENGRKPSVDSHVIEKRKLPAPNETTSITARDSKSQLAKKNEAAVRLNKPVSADSGPGRPPKSNMQRKSNVEPKMQQKVDNNALTKRPPIGQQDVRKNLFVDQICRFDVSLTFISCLTEIQVFG